LFLPHYEPKVQNKNLFYVPPLKSVLALKWDPLAIAAVFEFGPHLFTRCLHKSRKVNERILETTHLFIHKSMDNTDILPGNQPTIKLYKNK